ncbi:MAG: hypothetical protein QOF51_4226 [Chloroflexota bacterium]|jgi:hypothetical protein|nr:hypothetical protein [Chloroflexota bacterium]
MTPHEFLAGQLQDTQVELGTAILNRGRWEKLREHRQMLLFLQEQAAQTATMDFHGLRSELKDIAGGHVKPPNMPGPRTTAADLLQRWATVLEGESEGATEPQS